MQVEKYEKDGKVAVLISPGIGAGWSTWCEEHYKEFLLFDKALCQLVEKDSFTEQDIKNRLKEAGIGAYCGGAKQLTIWWLDKGDQFQVNEYNGSESLHVIGSRVYFTA